MRESSPLPAGRAEDDGEGGLEIRDVRLEDSGLYICVARLGRQGSTLPLVEIQPGETLIGPELQSAFGASTLMP